MSVEWKCPVHGCLRTFESLDDARRHRQSDHDDPPRPVPDGGHLEPSPERAGPSVDTGCDPQRVARYLRQHPTTVIQTDGELPTLVAGTDSPGLVAVIQTGHRTPGDQGCYSRLAEAEIVVDQLATSDSTPTYVDVEALDGRLGEIVAKHREGWL